jgi:hypothetical protein
MNAPSLEYHRLALFGWLRGTVVFAGDLTEPADPCWARRVDEE